VGALVVLAAQAGSIEPGAEAEIVVLVRNTGADPDTFHVVVEGDASRWGVVDPPHITLGPGEEGPVWVHFRPPRSPDTRPGTVPFAVAVASTTDPDFVAVETGELAIGTFSSLTASFVGEPSMGAKHIDLEVAVRNTGNRKVQVDVAAESLDAGVRFEVEPTVVDLPPGQPVNVHVRVRPPRRILPGRTRDREITVTVVSDGGAFAALRTEYPDDPTLSDELIRSARVLTVLLVLLFVGGIALLRSESTSGTVAVTPGGNRATLPTVAPTTAVPPPPTTSTSEATEEGPTLQPSPTAPPPRPIGAAPSLPRLVFVRIYAPLERDIIVRDSEGNGRELRLRVDDTLDSRPRLSPSGAHVAYISERNGAWRVCVIPSEGGSPVCVADTTSNAAVAWSADGQVLFFSRGGTLYSVTYDVSTHTVGPEVDRDIAVPGGNFGMAPDRTRIVVADGRRLAVRQLDGSAGVTIDVGAAAQDPSFSPDGTRLVYAANLHVYTVPAAGGTVRQLTLPGTVNGEPAWTGEGDWIVFRSNRSGMGDLYAVNGGGGSGEEQGLSQVTATDEREVTPSF
jgi:hypothetical protein